MMLELVGVALLAALAWLVVDGLRAREAAVDAARRVCVSEGVQFLDDTVMLETARFARDASGRLILRRVYRFEFSDTGNNRLAGTVALEGSRVHQLYLEPHRADDPASRDAHL